MSPYPLPAPTAPTLPSSSPHFNRPQLRGPTGVIWVFVHIQGQHNYRNPINLLHSMTIQEVASLMQVWSRSSLDILETVLGGIDDPVVCKS